MESGEKVIQQPIFRITISLLLFVLLALTGCNPAVENGKPGAGEKDGIQLNLEPAESVQLELVEYNGGFFTMKVPVNWTLETTGEYENFGFRLHDPACPAKQIFFYGNMKPFLKSEEAKRAWRSYLAGGGYAEAQLYADAPVLSPATTAQFFTIFDEFTALASRYGIAHNFPSFVNLEIVEQAPRCSPIASASLDDSILRGLFIHDQIPCEGLLAASVFELMTSYMGTVDAGYHGVYIVTGISAPADEFYLLEETLAESLASFQFDEDYVHQGVARKEWETKAALEVGKTLSEAAASYNQAWHERQRVYDALSQKRSDTTLGYDRLYDAETKTIYRAELGFYDEYEIDREKFANPNLYPVPDDNYDLYEKAISGYIYK